MGEHIVADEQVAALPRVAKSARERDSEELRHRVDTGIDGDLRHIACRLYTEHGNALLLEVLEEVSVVARDLDHQRARVEPESIRCPCRELAGVRKPAVGVRREIDVIPEDLVGRLELLELYEKAFPADVGAQRIEPLHPVEFVRLEKGIR